MTHIPHVIRRGAVYWWRRRIPSGESKKTAAHLAISLRTTCPRTARSLAGAMSARFDGLKWQWQSKSGAMLDRNQVRAIMEGVAAQHAMKLDALAAFERREAKPNFDGARYDSIINGLAHQLAADRGPSAIFTPGDYGLLAEYGLPPLSAEHVNRHLDELRHRRFLPTPRGKLEAIIAART